MIILVDICCKGSPERPPSSFLISLVKLSLLPFVVFVSIIADIPLFVAISTISEISLSWISGETFNKSGTFVFLSSFILLRESKRSLSFFLSWKSLKPSVFGEEILTVM